MAADGKAAEAAETKTASERDPTVFKWMQKHTVELFPFDREVVCIDAKASREEAYQTLADNNVLSAPVYDAARKKYLGMVDMGDVAAYMVDTYSDGSTSGSFATLKALIAAARAKSHADVIKLVDLSHHDAFKPMPIRTPLLMVVARLAGYPESLGVHRVPIVDPDTQVVVKIISQSAVIDVLSKHIDEFGTGLDATLEELGLARKPVVAVGEEDQALAAFRLMKDRNISAVAVVDAEGHLLANISNSDVKTMLGQNRVLSLAQTAMDFVAAVRAGDAARTSSGKSTAAAMHVHPETTVKQLISKLAATKVHRMYVCDAEGLLIGVVSLKDILRALVVDVGEANGWKDAIYMKPEYITSLGYV
mmetsp:Transcript_2890/g.7933  ORF Transcript_2890/g.7933 Transcript_2890/m.7933 type:complete len:363 (-) Transcript_2890:261-1349(-)